MKNRFFKIVVCLIILIVAFIGVDVFMSRAVDRNNGKGILINIPAGSSTSAIANTLYKKGTIRSKFFFRLNSKVLGYSGKYHAGSYLVKKSMSMKEQMDLIKSGKIAGKVFTVADGNNMFKTLNAMEKAKVINKTDFYNEIENGKFNYEFIKELPKGKNRLEGFLYPDTYNAPADATPHQVIDMMLKNFDRVFKKENHEKRLFFTFGRAHRYGAGSGRSGCADDFLSAEHTWRGRTHAVSKRQVDGYDIC